MFRRMDTGGGSKVARTIGFILMLVLIGPAAAVADPPYGMCPGCQMVGGGMWLGVVLVGLLLLAAIAALVALTVYLLRKSRPPGPPREA